MIISCRVFTAGIVNVRIVGSDRLLRFKNAYRVLIGEVGRLKSGMGVTIGMNVRRMGDVQIWLRIVIVVGCGIRGVVSGFHRTYTGQLIHYLVILPNLLSCYNN